MWLKNFVPLLLRDLLWNSYNPIHRDDSLPIALGTKPSGVRMGHSCRLV